MEEILKKSKYAYLLDLHYISEVFNDEIANYSIVELQYIRDIVYKFTIKYKSVSGDTYFIKKNDDYDFERVRKLMKLLFSQNGQENHLFSIKDKELIACRSIAKLELAKSMNSKNIKLSANMLSSFHNYPLKKFLKYINCENEDLEKIRYLAKRDTLGRIKECDNRIGNKLFSLYEEIIKIEKQVLKNNKHCLIHGDLHPGNIAIYKNEAFFIDHKNICSGLKERDVATMLEQIYALKIQNKLKINSHEIESLQKTFLDSYKNELKPSLITFFKSWISLRNSIYCFLKYFINHESVKRYNDSIIFLNNCENYLKEYKKNN